MMEDILNHGALVVISTLFSYSITHHMIPVVGAHFLANTHLQGIDMGNKDRKKLPESLGIVVGITYLASFLIFFIIAPITLVKLGILNSFSLADKICISASSSSSSSTSSETFANGYSNSLSILAAITSIFAMLMLGFIDDCYDLRWRYKLMFPFAASIPLLSVYYYSYRDRTIILLPQLLAKQLSLDEQFDLGIFYYIFMLMFVIFCTNAINIYAGINGLEVGQTIVLTVSVILYNLVEITTKSDCDEVHVLSLQLLIPFLLCSCALYKFNKYPARVFVGDSYCYFAGMTLAVVGILGHFSEEILIFALPQVFNFIVSIPQLFKIVPCPRHRLPKYNETTNLREPSTFQFRYSELNILARLVMKIYATVGFARLTKVGEKDVGDEEKRRIDEDVKNNSKGGEQREKQQQQEKQEEEEQYTSNNLTLINLWLCWFGPKHERILCHELLRLQCCLSFLAVAILSIFK